LRTKTQPGEGVLFFNEDPAYTSQTISVRYAALRPLVYTERDSGLLGYANRSLLQGWLATTREWEAVRAVNDPVERLAALVPLADRLGATYLVVDYPVPAEIVERLPASVLFKNDTYLVLKLH
jgi:hypothetical protein